MRVLRCPSDIDREIRSTVDPAVAALLTRQIEFMSEDESEESLTVVIVELGDTLEEVDTELNHYLLMDDYSGRTYVDAGFVPCFETVVEHPTLYEMFFVEGGGELGISVLIPKQAGMNTELLALCARHATPATEQSS